MHYLVTGGDDYLMTDIIRAKQYLGYKVTHDFITGIKIQLDIY